MKPIDTQLSFEDVSPEYKEFVEKFKPKKTTDDCYTPDNVYAAVLEWVCGEYGVKPENVVRPFWPGADYERFPYADDSVVVDNPPFSIVGQITKFYSRYEIPFFIFAPYLTNFSSGMGVSHIIQGESIVYQNGAEIGTSFLTNMDEYLVRGVPDLQEKIKAANVENLREIKRQLPKYAYPPEVLTATAVGYMSSHGVEFKVKPEDCFPVRVLDAQKAIGKAIFGGGFLLSERAAAERAAAERAAAERAAAERAAAERAAAHKWELSNREREIMKSLGDKAKEAQNA